MTRHAHAFGADEAVATCALLVGQSGARTFELAYDRADGAPLTDHEEPGPDEAVAWTATAEFPNGRTVTGTAISNPGEHRSGGALACVDLLRRLGANVTVLDAR